MLRDKHCFAAAAAAGNLPARDAHPIIWFSQEETEPQVVEGVPFDKYELEPSPLTQHILGMKNTNVCWLCYVPGSNAEEGNGKPFGYLKPSSQGNVVNLIIMPYDFPTLIPLLQGLRSYPKQPFTADWYAALVPHYFPFFAPMFCFMHCIRPFQFLGAFSQTNIVDCFKCCSH